MVDPSVTVSDLRLYPIKSLDPVIVDRVTVLSSGALDGDRRYAIVDADGKFINGKRDARIHAVRSDFDVLTHRLSLRVSGSDFVASFDLKQDHDRLTAWLSDYFGFPVKIVENREMGFPDDTASPGPTVVSTATLETIAAWFPELTLAEVRSRFRANIEISGVPPFWEDQLFGSANQSVPFQIGAVKVFGINPCQRCIVVTRDSQTGNPLPGFQKTFAAKRQETLPDWVNRSRFNHFFRLAINTQIPPSSAGKIISLGDRISILNT